MIGQNMPWLSLLIRELKRTGVSGEEWGAVSIEFLRPQERALPFRAACGCKKSIDPHSWTPWLALVTYVTFSCMLQGLARVHPKRPSFLVLLSYK